MPKCPCGKQFHACSSCGLSNSWEYEYCCIDHWRESKEYQTWKSKFKALYTTINSVQQKFLIEFLTEMSDDYLNEIGNWIGDIK